MKYRKDIDGLRALAVISVFLFHLDFEFIQGGFVGVDIFFVISGYLITKVILFETQANKFKISQFYLRRIRRIVPALFVVVFSTVIASLFYLPKSELTELFNSVISVSTFTSNIFFLQNSDYFSTAAELKPLLHTWSLGIEEQFYIFFPLLMWYLRNKSHHTSIIVVGVLIVISFVLSILPVAMQNPIANFYLPFTRFWELLIGSFIAIIVIKPLKNSFLINGISLFGLSLILYSLVFLKGSDVFPGWNAVPVVVGTAVLILFGSHKQNVFSVLFSHSIIRQFGLISYSMYLWHWPVIALLKNNYIGDFLLIDKLLIILAVTILSVVSYLFVEQPFRINEKFKNRLNLKTGLLSLLFLSIFAVLCQFIFAPKSTINNQSQEFQHASIDLSKVDVCFSHKETLETTKRCSFGKKDSSKIFLVFGDSHAAALVHALNKLAVDEGWRMIMAENVGCPGLFGVFKADNLPGSKNCLGVYAKNIENFLEENKIDKVFLISRWSLYQKGWIKNGRLQKASHFISDNQTISENAADSANVLDKALHRTVRKISQELKIAVGLVMYAPILPKHIDKMDGFKLTRDDYLTERSFVKTIFNKLGNLSMVDVIDPIESFCEVECVFTKNNKKLYKDESHMTPEGNNVFYPLLKASLIVN